MARSYFEDCRVGDASVSPVRTITEGDVVRFAAVSGDWMPIHTDAQYCAGTPLGDRIAHGILVLEAGCALLIDGAGTGLLPARTVRLASIDRVRFRAPTRCGDTIRTEAEIKALEPVDDKLGKVTILGKVKNQRGESAVAFTIEALAERDPARVGESLHGGNDR